MSTAQKAKLYYELWRKAPRGKFANFHKEQWKKMSSRLLTANQGEDK